MALKRNPLLRLLPVLGGALIVGVVVLVLLWFVRSMQKEPEQKRQTVQTVKLIRPPPPPPEPPPPPPPEEKVEEPLPQETPEEAPPDEASPAEQLGLDAEGVAGGDGFGLAARKGGRELGLGGAAFGWYTSLLKDSILDVLSGDERIRRGSYQVTVRVWLTSSGDVERIKLASTSGNHELDTAIERALEKVGRIREAPPLEMPQPVTLRIVSRG
ncbi:MAG TPA: TonB family protein [Steroidobacteraceae bacterium]|nr:TonB family protein [Steroidobacteraceae bacterium]